MGIGTSGMAFCTVLAIVGGALAGDVGPAMPAGATKLLAALLGEAHPGPLRVRDLGQGRSDRESSGRILRLGATDGTWMTVSPDGKAESGPTDYFAESVNRFPDGVAESAGAAGLCRFLWSAE